MSIKDFDNKQQERILEQIGLAGYIARLETRYNELGDLSEEWKRIYNELQRTDEELKMQNIDEVEVQRCFDYVKDMDDEERERIVDEYIQRHKETLSEEAELGRQVERQRRRKVKEACAEMLGCLRKEER